MNGTNGCMYNCGGSCTGECIEEISLEWFLKKYEENKGERTFNLLMKAAQADYIASLLKNEVLNPECIAENTQSHKSSLQMSKNEAKDLLIDVLYNQVIQLSMMSKIELGDDVISEIRKLKGIINE